MSLKNRRDETFSNRMEEVMQCDEIIEEFNFYPRLMKHELRKQGFLLISCSVCLPYTHNHTTVLPMSLTNFLIFYLHFFLWQKNNRSAFWHSLITDNHITAYRIIFLCCFLFSCMPSITRVWDFMSLCFKWFYLVLLWRQWWFFLVHKVKYDYIQQII